MILDVIQKINSVNELLFSPIDAILENMSCAFWIKEALIDSLHMVPFLLFIFFVIGFIEYFYSEKTEVLAQRSALTGPFIGSLLASIPQCGFSVMASSLYTRRLITRGTLLAVFIATSDEAIPVILAEPKSFSLVVPLVIIKIIIALIVGYGLDLVLKSKRKSLCEAKLNIDEADEGCCHHKIGKVDKKDLWLHPIVHTLNIFIFILLVTLIINYIVMLVGGEEALGKFLMGGTIFQPILTAIFGLIPNCAASVALTLMYMKGAIGFGAVISGLCSGAGLGLLVLLKKNNNKKDTCFIILTLLITSVVAGLIVQFLFN